MKKTAFALVSLILVAFSLPSCKKDQSFSEQLAGHWHSTEVKADGIDASAFYEYQLHLESSKEFDLDFITKNLLAGTRSTISYSGDWAEDSSKRDLTLTYSTGETRTYEVKDLSEDALSVEFIEGGKRFAIVFARQ